MHSCSRIECGVSEVGSESYSPPEFLRADTTPSDLLDVDKLEEPEINTHAIDKLVMKTESNKDLIKAICATYTSQAHGSKPYFADYIQGKGEGQVFLLHGPPGTGKTLTAGMCYVLLLGTH